MTTTPKALRTRNMTAAKRSLALIRDAAEQHMSILEEGQVPESNFWASTYKYEQARLTLSLLDSLGEDAGQDGNPDEDPDSGVGWATVRLDDLSLLIQVLREFVPADTLEMLEESDQFRGLVAVTEVDAS